MATDTLHRKSTILEWTMRVGKSMGYSALDAFKEQMPKTTRLVEDNKETAKQLYKDIIGSKMELNKLKDIGDNYIFKPTKELLKNIKEDLKSGNFYNKKRQEAAAQAAEDEMMSAVLEQFGMGDLADFLNGDEEVDEENANDMPVRPNPEISTGDAMIASVTAREARMATNSLLRAQTSLVDAQLKTARGIANLQLKQNQRHTSMMQQGFAQMTSGFNMMNRFNNEVMLKHAKNAQKFFTTMTQLTQENNAILKELIEMKRNLYKDHLQSMKDSEEQQGMSMASISNRLFKNGVLDLKQYIQVVEKQMGFMEIFKMMPLVMQEVKTSIDKFVANPLGTISTTAFKSMMGVSLRTALQEFDKNFNSFIQNSLVRLGRLGKSKNANMFEKFIGQLFGLDDSQISLRSIDTTKMLKGARHWDAEDHFHLTKVIPSYLARIESALTGAPERIFNTDSGKFMTTRAIDRQMRNEEKLAAKDELSEVLQQLKIGLMRHIKVNPKDQKAVAQVNKILNDFAIGVHKAGGFGGTGFSEIKDNAGGAYGNDAYVQLIHKLLTSQLVDRSAIMEAERRITSNRLDNRERRLQGTDLTFNETYAATNMDRTFNENRNKLSARVSEINKASLDAQYSLLEWQAKIHGTLVEIRNNIGRFGFPSTGAPTPSGGGGGGGAPNESARPENINLSEDAKVSEIKSKYGDYTGYHIFEDADGTIRYEDGNILRDKNGVYHYRDGNIIYNNYYLAGLENAKGKLTGTLSKYDILKIGSDPKALKAALKSIDKTAYRTRLLNTREKLNENSKWYDDLIIKDDGEDYIKTIIKSSTNPKENSHLLEQLAKAATIGEKMSVLSDNIGKIISSPRTMLTSVLAQADRLMFNILFGSATGEVDEKGKPITGLFNKMSKMVDDYVVEFNDYANQWLHDLRNNDKSMLQRAADWVDKTFNTNVGNQIIGLKDEASDTLNTLVGDLTQSATEGGKEVINDVSETAREFWDFINGRVENIKEVKGNAYGRALSLVSKGELILGRNGKGRNVTRSGFTTLGFDDTVIPSTMNPFNPNRATANLARDAANEERIRSSAISSLQNIPGFYRGKGKKKRKNKKRPAIPTQDIALQSQVIDENEIANSMAGDITEIGNVDYYKTPEEELRERYNNYANNTGIVNGMNQFMLQAFGTDPGLAAKKTKDLILDNSKSIAGGALKGAVAGTIFPLGGPLMGALAGASLNLLKKNDSFMEYMFGTKIMTDKEGKVHRANNGLISIEFMKSLEKYIPDMKKYGITGSLLGLVLPFGPLGGLMAGMAASYVKNNESMNEFLFGNKSDSKSGIFSKDRRQAIKRALPNIGTAMLGTFFLGPFGLLGNAALGAGLGLLSTSELFKKIMLGAKGRDGERHGGLAGAIRRHVVNPLKESMDEIKTNVAKWFKDDVIKPLGRGLAPIGNEIKDTVKETLSGAVNALEKRLAGTTGRYEKFFDTVLHPARTIGNIGKGVGKWAGRIAIEAPAKLIGWAGDKVQRKRLQTGKVNNLAAKQRLEEANRLGITDYKFKDFDTVLQDMDQSNIEKSSELLNAYSYAFSPEMANKIEKNLTTSFGYLSSDISKLTENNPKLRDMQYDLISIAERMKEAKDPEDLQAIFAELEDVKRKHHITPNSREYAMIDEVFNQSASELSSVLIAKQAQANPEKMKQIREMMDKTRNKLTNGTMSHEEFVKNLPRMSEMLGNEAKNRRRAQERHNVLAEEAGIAPDLNKYGAYPAQEETDKKIEENTAGAKDELHTLVDIMQNQFPALMAMNGLDPSKYTESDFTRAMADRMKRTQNFINEHKRMSANATYKANAGLETKVKDMSINKSIKEFDNYDINDLFEDDSNTEVVKDILAIRNANKELEEKGENPLIIDSLTEVLKLDPGNKKHLFDRITQLTLYGYHVSKDDYEDLMNLTKTGFELVAFLVSVGGKFDGFKEFLDIPDTDEGKQISKAMKESVSAEISANGKSSKITNVVTMNALRKIASADTISLIQDDTRNSTLQTYYDNNKDIMDETALMSAKGSQFKNPAINGYSTYRDKVTNRDADQFVNYSTGYARKAGKVAGAVGSAAKLAGLPINIAYQGLKMGAGLTWGGLKMAGSVMDSGLSTFTPFDMYSRTKNVLTNNKVTNAIGSTANMVGEAWHEGRISATYDNVVDNWITDLASIGNRQGLDERIVKRVTNFIKNRKELISDDINSNPDHMEWFQGVLREISNGERDLGTFIKCTEMILQNKNPFFVPKRDIEDRDISNWKSGATGQLQTAPAYAGGKLGAIVDMAKNFFGGDDDKEDDKKDDDKKKESSSTGSQLSELGSALGGFFASKPSLPAMAASNGTMNVPTSDGSIIVNTPYGPKRYTRSSADGQLMEANDKNNQETNEREQAAMRLQERTTEALERLAGSFDGTDDGKGGKKKKGLGLLGTLMGFASAFGSVCSAAISKLKGFGKWMLEGFLGILDHIPGLKGIADAARSALGLGGKAAEAAAKGVEGAAAKEVAGAAEKKAVQTAEESAAKGGFGAALKNFFKPKVEAAKTAVSETVSPLVEAFKSKFLGCLDDLIKTAEKFVPIKGIGTFFSKFKTAFVDLFKNARFVKALVPRLSKIAGSAVTGVVGISLIDVAFMGYGFYDGVTDTANILNIPDGSASMGMRLLAGLAGGIAGHTIMGIVALVLGFLKGKSPELAIIDYLYEAPVLSSVINLIVDKKELAELQAKKAGTTQVASNDGDLANPNMSTDELQRKLQAEIASGNTVGAMNTLTSYNPTANLNTSTGGGGGSLPNQTPNRYATGRRGRGRFESQLDPRNAMRMQVPGDTEYMDMANRGCGEIATVNALHAQGNYGVNGRDAGRFALRGHGFGRFKRLYGTNKYLAPDDGTTPAFIHDYARSNGMSTKNLNGRQDFDNYIDNGGSVVISGRDTSSSTFPVNGGESLFTDQYHYGTVVGRYTDANGRSRLRISDPQGETSEPLDYYEDDVFNKSNVKVGVRRGLGKHGRLRRLGRYKFGRNRFGRAAVSDMMNPEQIALEISNNTKLPPELVWAQMAHETGNFESDLAKEHNYGGVKDASGEDQTGTTSKNGYSWTVTGFDSRGHSYFDTDRSFVNYMSWYYPLYKDDGMGIFNVKSPADWASVLKAGGYYTDSEENYRSNIEGIIKANPDVMQRLKENRPSDVPPLSMQPGSSATGGGGGTFGGTNNNQQQSLTGFDLIDNAIRSLKDTELGQTLGKFSPFFSNFFNGNKGGTSGGAGANGTWASSSTDAGIKAASQWADSMVGSTGYGNNGCTEFVKNYLLKAGNIIGKYMEDGSPIAGEIQAAAAKVPDLLDDDPNPTLMWVPTLEIWAKDKNYWKDASVGGAEGDICVCNDHGHVIIADGKGGAWGNSSSRNQIVHYPSIAEAYDSIQGYIATGAGQNVVSSGTATRSREEMLADGGTSNTDYGAGKYGRNRFGRKKKLRSNKEDHFGGDPRKGVPKGLSSFGKGSNLPIWRQDLEITKNMEMPNTRLGKGRYGRRNIFTSFFGAIKNGLKGIGGFFGNLFGHKPAQKKMFTTKDGIKVEQNDLDYLVNQGYSQEDAIKFLLTDKKYADQASKLPASSPIPTSGATSYSGDSNYDEEDYSDEYDEVEDANESDEGISDEMLDQGARTAAQRRAAEAASSEEHGQRTQSLYDRYFTNPNADPDSHWYDPWLKNPNAPHLEEEAYKDPDPEEIDPNLVARANARYGGLGVGKFGRSRFYPRAKQVGITVDQIDGINDRKTLINAFKRYDLRSVPIDYHPLKEDDLRTIKDKLKFVMTHAKKKHKNIFTSLWGAIENGFSGLSGLFGNIFGKQTKKAAQKAQQNNEAIENNNNKVDAVVDHTPTSYNSYDEDEEDYDEEDTTEENEEVVTDEMLDKAALTAAARRLSSTSDEEHGGSGGRVQSVYDKYFTNPNDDPDSHWYDPWLKNPNAPHEEEEESSYDDDDYALQRAKAQMGSRYGAFGKSKSSNRLGKVGRAKPYPFGSNPASISNDKLDSLIKEQKATNELLSQILQAIVDNGIAASAANSEEENAYSVARGARSVVGRRGSEYGMGPNYMVSQMNRGKRYDDILWSLSAVTSR